MADLNRFTAPLWDLDTFHVWNDFEEDQSDIRAVDTVTDTGTVAIGDTARGVAVLTPSDGTVADNDEAYLATPNELFIFAAGRPLYGRFRIQFTEANTDDANIAVGFQNAVGANSIVDDGAGVKTSGSTLAIYKVDGGTKWICASACNGVATTTTSTTTAGGASYQTLEIVCQDFDTTNMEVVFKCDGVRLKDSNNNDIRHFVPIANATEMSLWAGVKNGGANLETLNLDYWYGAQKR